MGAISRLQSVAGHPPGLGFSQALEALKADGSLGLTPRLSDVRSSESGACCVAVCFKQARCFKRATLAENGFQTPRRAGGSGWVAVFSLIPPMVDSEQIEEPRAAGTE